MKKKTYLIVSIALLAGMSVWAQEPVTVSIYEDCSKNGKIEDIRSYGEENGHTWVNLCLPSGLKWASYNVGATTPEDYGDHFAWGEILPKSDYSWDTYKYANGGPYKLTKYCCNKSYGDKGFTDGRTTLKPEDDAATTNWGGTWRMPTYYEWEELLKYCTWTSTTQNGVYGNKVTSKTNGNSIFLPCTGYYDGTHRGNSWCGYYWSSSLSLHDQYRAWYVGFPSDDYIYEFNRQEGYTIRPVCP